MEDEPIVPTPAEEAKASEPVTEPQPAEPEVPAAEAQPEERYASEPEPKETPDSVPLHVHTQVRDKLKNEVRELREQLKNHDPSAAKLAQIAEKWGVDAADVQELAAAIKSDSTRDVETKLGSIEQQQKQAKIDEAFDGEFAKLVKNYPQLEDKKKQLKQLAFTKDYVKSPLEDIAQDVFGSFLSKATIEEGRPASDKPGDVLDFSKPLTTEMWAKIKNDPKAKKAYYDYMDSQ